MIYSKISSESLPHTVTGPINRSVVNSIPGMTCPQTNGGPGPYSGLWMNREQLFTMSLIRPMGTAALLLLKENDMKTFFKNFFSTSNEINENTVMGFLFALILVAATFTGIVPEEKYYILAGTMALFFGIGAFKK
jgi:hypothetical protein